MPNIVWMKTEVLREQKKYICQLQNARNFILFQKILGPIKR